MSFDLTLPVLFFLAIGLATCGEAAAQPVDGPSDGPAPFAEGPPPEPAEDLMRDEALAELAAQQAEVARQDSLAQAEANARALAEAARLARPVVYATGYGLTVTLPGGWEGPVTAQEDAFPGYALYTFDNARLDRAVPGARVRIERIGALNPLDAQRWQRGQSAYGLHGLRPVAPADASAMPLGTQAAVVVAGDGVHGITAYARRGTTYWAIQATVPTTVYDAAPRVLVDLLRGVELPDGAGLPTEAAPR